MSGVAGWVDLTDDVSGDTTVVWAMTDALAHRGPDGKGVWTRGHAAIGHRRLATAPGQGEQPAAVAAGDADVVLAYDGHVTNLAELRSVVGPQGGTDTEVLLAAYLRWGPALAEHLHGAFALAVWDARSGRLVLARDRFGLKPLYYARFPGGIAFGSEPKAVYAHPRFTARLDPAALPILLQPRLATSGETPLAGLREVPAAHTATFSDAGVAEHRYWRLTSAPHTDSFEDTAARVRELLAAAVRGALPPAGPCSAMLSGGVDSTSVAALAARAFGEEHTGRVLETFCVRFASDGEHFAPTELRPEVDAPYAEAAARLLGTSHTTLTVTTDDLTAAIPATRHARDLPGWGQFDASMYLLFQAMAGRGPVALSGEAADEFFGGYPYFFKSDLVGRDTFPWLGDGPRLADYLSPELGVDAGADERARYERLLADVPRLDGEDPAGARMREVLYLGMAGPLTVVLDRKERMSMAHGLEVRLPFCDHRLVEYVWNVPWSVKSTGGLKGLLKAATADLLPPATLDRRKSAYPHVHDPRHERAVVQEASWIVNAPESPLRGLVDAPRFNALLRRVAANDLRSMLPGGASGAQLLVQLVELRQWVEEHRVALP